MDRVLNSTELLGANRKLKMRLGGSLALPKLCNGTFRCRISGLLLADNRLNLCNLRNLRKVPPVVAASPSYVFCGSFQPLDLPCPGSGNRVGVYSKSQSYASSSAEQGWSKKPLRTALLS